MPVVPALDVSRYYLFQELSDYLRTAEEAAPHFMRLFSIGTSYEGRPLLLVEITNRASGEGHEKPAIWVDGNLQGRELFGSSACLELVRQLTSNYGRDAAITDLVDNCTFYIAPRLSPDGAEHCLTTGELVRSGTRPYPPNTDGRGLQPSDVDGDGQVLQMRVIDPQGEWKLSRRDPRLLVPRLADDRHGQFYRLYSEGMIEDFDGRVRVQPPRSNLDFDRNFPFRWSPGWELEGAGPYPLSEPETRAVIDFFRTHRNLCLMLSCGSMGSGVEAPSSSGADENLFRLFGRRIEELCGYELSFPAQAQPGSFLEWAYQHQGLVAFRVNPWCFGRAAGVEVKDPEAFRLFRSEPDNVALLRWLDRELHGRGFGPWTAFDHPQLGLVEIGGWNLLSTWLNPPPGGVLQEEVDRFARLCLGMAASMPRLGIRACTEEVVGWSEFTSPEVQQGEFLPLRKVRVELQNQGYLSTWLTERARQSALADPIHLRLLMDGQSEVLLGQATHPFGHLSGSSTALCTGGFDAAWFPGADESQRGSYEWLVRGSGRLQVEARQSKAGVVTVASQMGRASHPVAEIPQAPGLVQAVQHPPPPPLAPPPPPMAPPPAMAPPRPSVDPRIAAAQRASGFGNLPTPPVANPGGMPSRPVPSPTAPGMPRPLTAPPNEPAIPRPAAFGPPRGAVAVGHVQPQAHAPRPPVPQQGYAPPRPGGGSLPPPPGAVPPPGPGRPPSSPVPGPLSPSIGVRPVPSPVGNPLAPEDPPLPPLPSSEVPAPSRGRVFGAPPTRPGQEPAGNRSQEGMAPARPGGGDFEPFSPGLPIKPAYASPAGQQQPSPLPQWPAESAPSAEMDMFPPEAPAAESRIPAPLLLRKRDGSK